ncbi:MAG: MinD/ParA family protein [Planctomycetota bacterium]|nr:MinD/ParA family protein [Planctomycetota bacterium]
MRKSESDGIATGLADAPPAPAAKAAPAPMAPAPSVGARAAHAAQALATLAASAAKTAAAHASRPDHAAIAAAPLPAAAASTSKAGGVLKRVVRDLHSRARVVAIVSGKGGVGKTNVAVNVAIALAAAGQRVLLVDADLGLANVDLVLGQRAHGDLGHVLSGKMALGDIIQEGPAGIRWIPGASHMPALSRIGERRREALLERLTVLETQHDYLLLDAPAGIGQGVLHLARQADELVLVTTPEPTAMMDAYTLLKAAAPPGRDAIGRVRLVVNMVSHRRQADEVHRRIAQTAARFLGLDVCSSDYVFCDGHVGRAVQKQQPLLLAYPHSQAAWCMKRLGGALAETRESPLAARFAFFRRLANLFATG